LAPTHVRRKFVEVVDNTSGPRIPKYPPVNPMSAIKETRKAEISAGRSQNRLFRFLQIPEIVFVSHLLRLDDFGNSEARLCNVRVSQTLEQIHGVLEPLTPFS
jgi:hypothetical protein